MARRQLGVAPSNAVDAVTKAYADAGDARIAIKSGTWFYTCGGSASGTGAPGVNNLKLSPWLNRGPVTITKWGCFVTASGGATSTFRLGIYNDDGSGYPGSLLLDSGTVDCTTTGTKTLTLGSSLVLPAGLYWIGGVAQGTSGGQTMSTTAGALDFLPGIVYASLTTTAPASPGAIHAYVQTGVTGALPANFTTTLGTSGNGTRIILGT